MKGKLILLWLVLITSCIYAQTWVRQLEWEDLVPVWEHNPDANSYNVIPAVDGGYIMHGVVTIHNYVDEFTNVFWKVTESGEVLWRNDQPTFDNTPMTCLVSNGVDKYYGLSSEYHRNILYTYDTQLNPINSIMIDTLLTNGEDIQIGSMLSTNDGLVLGGRNEINGFMMKISYGYEVMWSHTYNSIMYGIGKLYGTNDGGIITYGTHYILRLNTYGDSLWVYEGTSQIGGFSGIICKSDGTYLVNGSGSNYQPYLYQLNEEGCLMNGYPYTLPGALGSGGAFLESPDDMIAMLQARYSGYSNDWQEYGMLHKVSPTGNVVWSNVFLQHPDHYKVGWGRNPIFVDDQGYYILCIEPMRIIRADENGNAVANDDPTTDIPGVVSVLAYPNPVKDHVCFELCNFPRSSDLKLDIYNLRGQLMYQINLDKDESIKQWVLPSNSTNGVYLYKVVDHTTSIYCGKFTVIR